MNKITWIIASIITVALVGWVVFGGSAQQKKRQSTPYSPGQTKFTQQYGTSTFAVSFRYPKIAEVSTEADSVKVQIIGPGNEPNTEITDGINGYIQIGKRNEDNLKSTAQNILHSVKEKSEGVIEQLTPANFAGRSGFRFRVRSLLGSTSTHYVLPGTTSRVLHVNYTASGTNASSYVNTFERMVETVQITKQQNKNDTPSDTPSDTGQNPSLDTLCKSAGGNWLGQYNECEYVSKKWCQRYGGSYEFCASACRHNPDAQVCTQQCVQVCKFSDSKR